MSFLVKASICSVESYNPLKYPYIMFASMWLSNEYGVKLVLYIEPYSLFLVFFPLLTT